MAEWSIESRKAYSDPFNDVEADVIFSKDGKSWRVPTFWSGGQRWTVRFAPPSPGDYSYHLESTDPSNPDLNGNKGHVRITPYRGSKQVLRHGMLGVSASMRHFEFKDGTPFYWLADTWWTGLSSRLSWRDFQTLVDDRKAKGFTVVQIVAGLIPNEELPPVDPGYGNEGGQVWDANFQRINPGYFDYADRRIQHLLDAGLVPAIVGAWRDFPNEMGLAKLKQHWRYIIARYGAYPVFWILGGEVVDAPDGVTKQLPALCRSITVRGWSDVARYVRAIDPYHHPLTVHEFAPPCDYPLQTASLTDFDMIHAGHRGWLAVGTNVAQVNRHYARTDVIKPIVQGEIGYEKLGETHLEDFQRAAFWLSMLNGAAGHSYGANGTWEAYTTDKLFQRLRYSFMTWDEGMNLPGSYQVGLGAKLMRQYPWWRFAPHPEWVSPRGTTLLDPQAQNDGFDLGSWEPAETIADLANAEGQVTGGGSKGSFRRAYAAGIPREVRIVYMPYLSFATRTPPTILRLELGVRYRAFFWQPAQGIRIELGAVERPPPGPLLFEDSFTEAKSLDWSNERKGTTGLAIRSDGALVAQGDTVYMLKNIRATNAMVAVEGESAASLALVLRHRDASNYVAAIYDPQARAIYLLDRRNGDNGSELGKTTLPIILEGRVGLRAEVRGNKAIASVTDAKHTYTTPIVDLNETTSGRVGLMHSSDAGVQRFDNFELRESPRIEGDEMLARELRDAKGLYRGELVGEGMVAGPFHLPGWSQFGRDKHILLDSYRPERMPTPGDWILILEAARADLHTTPQ